MTTHKLNIQDIINGIPDDTVQCISFDDLTPPDDMPPTYHKHIDKLEWFGAIDTWDKEDATIGGVPLNDLSLVKGKVEISLLIDNSEKAMMACSGVIATKWGYVDDYWEEDEYCRFKIGDFDLSQKLQDNNGKNARLTVKLSQPITLTRVGEPIPDKGTLRERGCVTTVRIAEKCT